MNKDKLSKLNDDLKELTTNQVLKKPRLQYELKVLALLHFQPQVPRILVMNHLYAICRLCDKPLEDFIGKDA